LRPAPPVNFLFGASGNVAERKLFDAADQLGYAERMQVLRYAKLAIPRKLEASFEKVRAAIERDDFYSADLKKLAVDDFFRAKLDYDSRLLVRFVEFAGRRACLALEIVEQHAYDRSRFLRGARVDATAIEALPSAGAPDIAGSLRKVRYLHPARTEFHLLDKPLSFDDRQEELFRLPLPMVLVGCAGTQRGKRLQSCCFGVRQRELLRRALVGARAFDTDSCSNRAAKRLRLNVTAAKVCNDLDKGDRSQGGNRCSPSIGYN